MDQDAFEAKQLYNDQSDLFSGNQSQNPEIHNLRKIVFELVNPSPNDHLLFAGCGDGTECILAEQHGCRVNAIDISENNIKKANDLKLSNTTFDVMNIQDLKFKNSSFDFVISILAVMYTEDLDETIKGFKRVLKDQGKIILVVPHPVIKMLKYNAKENYFLRGKQWEKWEGIQRFNYYRLFEDYVETFTKAGLVITNLLEPEPYENKGEKIKYPLFIVFELRSSP